MSGRSGRRPLENPEKHGLIPGRILDGLNESKVDEEVGATNNQSF